MEYVHVRAYPTVDAAMECGLFLHMHSGISQIDHAPHKTIVDLITEDIIMILIYPAVVLSHALTNVT